MRLAVLSKTPELAAFAFAGRSRALRGIEGVPVATKIGDIGAARVSANRQIEKRVSLLADIFRHFLQVDPIEVQSALTADKRDHLFPDKEKTIDAHPIGELLPQEWCIVVAQLRA